MTQSAFAALGEGHGIAEGGCGLGVGMAVISGFRPASRTPLRQSADGHDEWRSRQRPCDGWVTFAIPVIAAHVSRQCRGRRVQIPYSHCQHAAGAGIGRRRQATAARQTRKSSTGRASTNSPQSFPATGRSTRRAESSEGWNGSLGQSSKIDASGNQVKLPNITTVTIEAGRVAPWSRHKWRRLRRSLERDPDRVLHDVVEYWETDERARDIYGVILKDDAETGWLSTARQRGRGALSCVQAA